MVFKNKHAIGMFLDKKKTMSYEYIVQCIKMVIKKTKIYDFQKHICIIVSKNYKPMTINRSI